jgi:hypothetical protein
VDVLRADVGHEAAGERRLPRPRQRVIAVVERRAAADVVQAAGGAGVAAGDVVEAVAERGLRRRTDARIGARERGGVTRGRDEVAAADAGAWRGDAIEDAVDRGRRVRRDRDDPGPRFVVALDVGEEEGAITDQRALTGGAELADAQRILATRKRIAGVERVVAPERIAASAGGVGARAGDHREGARRRPPELRGRTGRHHLELADDLLRVEGAREAGRVVVRRQAVDDEGVVQVALRRHRDAGAGHRGGFREALRRAGVRARHARREERQVQVVAAVDRERLDLARGDGRSSVGPRRFDRARRRHRDLLLDPGNLDPDRQVHVLADRQRELAPHRPEAIARHCERVAADRQREEQEAAGAVDRLGPVQVGVELAQVRHPMRDDRPGPVAHLAADPSGRGLCSRETRQHRDGHEDRRPSHPEHRSSLTAGVDPASKAICATARG